MALGADSAAAQRLALVDRHQEPVDRTVASGWRVPRGASKPLFGAAGDLAPRFLVAELDLKPLREAFSGLFIGSIMEIHRAFSPVDMISGPFIK